MEIEKLLEVEENPVTAEYLRAWLADRRGDEVLAKEYRLRGQILEAALDGPLSWINHPEYITVVDMENRIVEYRGKEYTVHIEED